MKIRDFRSPDPLDHFEDPLDQPNRNRQIQEEPPPPVEMDVRRLRLRLGFTQRHFAWAFGFPVATLRHWERGNRRPTGTALVLLHVIRENPQIVRQAVRKARKLAPGSFGTLEPSTSHRAPPGMAVPI
jgi:DNA-binding transcriptional regulator YiaG